MRKQSEIRADYDMARSYVSRLCQPRGTQGSLEWIMSIPACLDDPDLVIARSLNTIPDMQKWMSLAKAYLEQYRDYCIEAGLVGTTKCIEQLLSEVDN